MTKKPSRRSDNQSFGKLPEQNANVASPKYNVRTVEGGFQKRGKKYPRNYKENIPEIRNGIVVPKEKIDWDIISLKGYVWLIRLEKPYYIDSMRFYIDGGNSNRKYKFYIETSLNKVDWEEVADKRDEFVNGWQIFRFTSKPIVYISITLTACNQNGPLFDFWPKNFECPSSV